MHGSLQNGEGKPAGVLHQFVAIDNFTDKTCTIGLCGVKPSPRHTEIAREPLAHNPSQGGEQRGNAAALL
jgi:hypothetical protein